VDIYCEEKFPNMLNSFNHSKNFLKKCINGMLNNITIIKTEKPKISAIMTFYNNRKTISRAIKSIQNQNISDIEIILINDFSTDNSLSIVENIQKNDSRIKIINNKKNMGTLFSRSIGVFSSKGKYIFHLDGDDMFLDEDVFSTIMNIAEKGGFDIVSFKCIYLGYGNNILTNQINDNYLNFHYDNKVLFQPDLGVYPVKPGKTKGKYKVIENFLWSKCIKTDVYQTTLNKIGKERYSRYMRYEEDRTVLYALFNVAESMKFVGK
jgi:glycosyltransferase involved in cell wall biosynthesis